MTAKYVIIIPDGAADEPIEQFDGKTIFEAANIPNIDKLSQGGIQGTVRTVEPGMTPGSDVAMMALLGYEPNRYYSGRAPIEAVAMNIDLDEADWVFRCNLVTIADGLMADHSAGHISTEEGAKLIAEINESIADANTTFHPGVSYRNLCVISGADFDIHTTPPHDIIGQSAEQNLPNGEGAEMLIDMMARSQQLFADHEINRIRTDLGENPASSIWLWGQGRRAQMESFEKRFGLKGAAITAVDLVRGLAKLIDFDLIAVEGATGFVDTNYKGKAEAAIAALEEYDIVIVRVEAPDEAGHSGSAETKKTAVERIDKYIVAPVHEALQKYEQWRILVMPDHPTPVANQAHSAEPVPFVIAGTNVKAATNKDFGETNAAETGFNIAKGYELMEYFVKI